MKKVFAGLLIVFFGGLLCTSIVGAFEKNGLIGQMAAQSSNYPVFIAY